MDNLEVVLRANLDHYMDDVNTALVGVVVGVQRLNKGLIDVQPVANNYFPDGEFAEYPVIRNVQVIMPSTSTSSITMPVKQGDNVLLVFSQRDISAFKSGAITAHNPPTSRTFNINDAVAIVGLFPTNKTKLSPTEHVNDFDNESLVITHNIGTDREVSVALRQSGDLDVVTPSNLNIKASVMNVSAKTVNVDATVMIEGMNLNNFMKQHTHDYTDDGRPMTTNIPKGF